MVKSRPVVVHILSELLPSGMEAMLACAARDEWMSEWDHRIIATGRTTGEYAAVLADHGYRIEHVPFRKSPIFFFELWRTIRACKADIVHIHTEGASFYSSLTGLAAGARCVRTVHNQFEFEGWLRMVRSAQRRIMGCLGVIFCAVSPRVAENERSRFGQDMRVVENWYDDQIFYPASPAIRQAARERLGLDDAFVIISVGNCNGVKNHELIIQALSHPRLMARNLVYLHCGRETADREEAALALSMGVADKIRFLGAVSDVVGHLAAADAFVASSFYEGASIALLEAAATGLPCISTDVGIADRFADFEAMTLTDFEVEDLANAIADRMDGKSPPCRSLSDHVARTYGAEVGPKRYLAIYAEALAPS